MPEQEKGYRPVKGAPKGWRARIGLLVPAGNTTIEPEFYQMAPLGVTIHSARMARTSNLTNAAGVLEYSRSAESGARFLATTKADIIIFGCTTGSLVQGVGWDAELAQKIESISGITATTTSTAVVEAMRKTGMKRVSVATPYTDELNEREKVFLEGSGFEVLNIQGLGLARGGIEEVSAFEVYRLAKEVDRPEADGLFISCTNFRTIEIIELLERDLAKPVVSSNQASMWWVLQKLDIHDSIVGYGQLFK